MKLRLLASPAFWLIALPVSAQQVDDIVVFGDSLSDPGNIPGLTGGVNFPPTPPYVGNRFSNGPVYSETLPSLLGGTFNPSLNFAAGGALTGSDNLNSNRSSLDPGSDLSGIVLPGIQTQVNGFVAGGGRLDANDLVIVYGGANDVFVAAEAAAALPLDQIPALVRSTAATAAQNITTSVRTLSTIGGDFFVLPNLPDIGATPAFTVGGAGSIALGSSFATAHNLALDQAALGLQAQTGANIIVFDVDGIVKDIQANPERYGITNFTDACIDTPSCVTGDLATQNQFLFFDGVHPTAGVHDQLATILATTVRAPTTLAAQGDATLAAAEDFQRSLIESFNPVAATAAVSLGSGRALIDTAETANTGSTTRRSTNLFLLASRTERGRDERAGALGFDDDLSTFTAGVRHQLNPKLLLGGAFRIGTGDTDIDGGVERFDHQEMQLGLSATLGKNRSYLMALANVGTVKIKNIERRTGIDQIETSGDTDGFIYGAGIAAGYLIPLADHVHLGPVGSLLYSAVNLDSYVENGPGFLSQKVENQNDITSLVLSVGTALEIGWDAAETHDVRLRLSALLEHDFDDGDRTITSSFVTSPTTLQTTIGERDQTTGRLGADVGFSLTEGIDVGLGYETVVGFGDGNEHSIIGRAVLSF